MPNDTDQTTGRRGPGRLTLQADWDQQNDAYPLQEAPATDLVRVWLEQHLARESMGNGKCFEVGCYPGRYLAVFGRRGFELHGIDLTPGVQSRMPDWLRAGGYPTGEFIRQDFMEFTSDQRFHVVCSFGFLEHFVDWRAVLRKHAALVEPGGLLIVSVPNFRGGVQRGLHRWLDAVNLAKHNLDSMRPREWWREIQPLGFEALFCGCFGHFVFWAGRQERTPRQQRWLFRVARSQRWLRHLPAGWGLYAPFCGLVARRTER